MIHRIAAATLFVAVLAVLPDTMAHHAFSAEFDANAPIRITGRVVKVEWINPHAWVHVQIERADGATLTWELEAGTPNTLLRRGLTRTLLLPGTPVTVRGYQSKDKLCDPTCKGSGRDITFADGRKMFMGSSGTGAPRDGADPTEPSRP